MKKFDKAEFRSFHFMSLGILVVGVCFAIDSGDKSYNDCNVRGGRTTCYFVGNHTEQTWYLAQKVCQGKNSTLPIIRSSEEQTAFQKFLNNLPPNAIKTNAVWTSGKKKIYNNWTWINGQTLNKSYYTNAQIIPGSAGETHMQINMTTSKSELRPADPLSLNWYLCQYKDRQCRDQFAVNATDGCYVSSGDNVASWYNARKSCLSRQGDLAILTEQDIQILSNSRILNTTHWIGLKKSHWIWKTGPSVQASEKDEVKYSNWASASMSTDGDLCISIYANDSQWRALNCSDEKFSVVCEKRVSANADSSTGISTFKTTVRNFPNTNTNAATTNDHNVSPMSDTKLNDSTDNSKTGENTSIGLIAGIVAGVVIFILCIFAILVVMCRKSKSSNIKAEPAQIDSETGNESKAENTKEKSSNRNEERCIYADIPRADKTTNDALEDGQKGITYASLDFNEGVTSPIPTSRIQSSDVSGPIYAQPFKVT